MLDAKKRAEIDQHMALLVDVIPPVLFRMYAAFKDAGFNEGQALLFTMEYLRATMGQKSE